MSPKISNRIQRKLNRKADMKIKEYLMITMGALAFLLITGIAKADTEATPKTVTGKVQSHIQMEIAKTKEFQKQSWEDAKIQFANLKKLFIKN